MVLKIMVKEIPLLKIVSTVVARSPIWLPNKNAPRLEQQVLAIIHSLRLEEIGSSGQVRADVQGQEEDAEDEIFGQKKKVAKLWMRETLADFCKTSWN